MTHRLLLTSLPALLLSITVAAPIGVGAAVPERTPTQVTADARPADAPAIAGASVPAPGAPNARALSIDASALTAPRLVRIRLGDGLALSDLLRGGFDVVGVQGEESASILQWPKDDARIAALGGRIEVIDEHPGLTQAEAARADVAQRVSRLGAQTQRTAPRRVVSTESRGSLTAPPTFGTGSLGGYWGTGEIEQKLDALVANDTQDLVADQVDVIGLSRQERPIWGLEIGKHVVGPDTRPVVFLNSLTHSREPGGMQTLFLFIDDILSRYGADPDATYLLDHRRIYICPLVNPDGYAVNEAQYAQNATFGFWRKNTRDNNANTIIDANDGVDINRNFGFQWAFDDVGSSPSISDDTYRGPSAFSEPETQVQRDLIASLHPVTGLSFHTYQDILVHPWGYTNTPTLDAAAFHEWDDLLTRFNAYQSGTPGPILYQVNGDINDWCYGDTLTKPRSFSWTPEIGADSDGFWPTLSRVAVLAAENMHMCYTVAAIAGPAVRADGVTVLQGTLNVGGFGRVSVAARHVGATGTAGPGLAATLTPIDAGIQMLQSTVSYPTLSPRTTSAPSNGETFAMTVDDTVTAGRMMSFRIDWTDGAGLFSRDTIRIVVGTPTVLASDDASSGTGLWTKAGAGPPNQWGVVSSDPNHASPYFSDSPAGAYGLGASWAFMLTAPLDLSHGVHAYAIYDMRWEFERDRDAGISEGSLNGSTWTPLWATGSTHGTSLLPEPALNGKPVYAGTRWQWKTEWADLSPFTGAAGSATRFRFRTRTNNGSQYDGQSVDAIRFVIYDPAAQPAPLAVEPGSQPAFALSNPWPNPARGAMRFDYALAERAAARLDVLDVQGRLVRSLASGEAPAGRYQRTWDRVDARGARTAPGVYFVRLALPGHTLTRRFVVLD